VTKVVVSGYYGFNNFGDETILKVLTDKLKELGCNVTVISSNPLQTAKLHDVKAVKTFDFKNIISEIISSNMLISGGGSLLQDVTSIKSLLYYLCIIFLALLLRKKVIIFAQGIGPINSRIGKLLTKICLKKVTYISVRDKKSQNFLQDLGIISDLTCDPLWELKIKERTPQNKIGIQLRNFSTLTKELLVKLAEAINTNYADKEIEIYSFQDSLDLDICRQFESIIKSINPQINTTVHSNLSTNDIIDHFSKLEALIAMRFHACLLAIKYGIKTLAINYDIKVEKLALDAKIPSIAMDNKEDFSSKIKELNRLDSSKMIEFSSSKVFDWVKLINFIN